MFELSHLWAGWHQHICVIQLLPSFLDICARLDKIVVNLVKCANNPQDESTMGCSHKLHRNLKNPRRYSVFETLILGKCCIEPSGHKLRWLVTIVVSSILLECHPNIFAFIQYLWRDTLRLQDVNACAFWVSPTQNACRFGCSAFKTHALKAHTFSVMYTESACFWAKHNWVLKDLNASGHRITALSQQIEY